MLTGVCLIHARARGLHPAAAHLGRLANPSTATSVRLLHALMRSKWLSMRGFRRGLTFSSSKSAVDEAAAERMQTVMELRSSMERNQAFCKMALENAQHMSEQLQEKFVVLETEVHESQERRDVLLQCRKVREAQAELGSHKARWNEAIREGLSLVHESDMTKSSYKDMWMDGWNCS